MKKQIYLEPTWKVHIAYRDLIASPPEGYRFVSAESAVDKVSLAASRWQLGPWLLAQGHRLAPLTLLKSYLDRFIRRPPEGTALTFACGHLVFRHEPWVIELGSVADPIGPPPHYNGRRCKHVIETAFASAWCKKVLCWSEVTKRTALSSLDCSQFLHKLEVVPRAVRPRSFVRPPRDSDGVRLMFLGSANMAGEFEARGGREVVEAFLALRQRYDRLELTIRSDVPPHVRRKLGGWPGIRVVQEVIPYEELEREFLAADIFLFPGYYSAWLVILEAMAYEVPVIATDVHGTRELVKDGETGLLIPGAKVLSTAASSQQQSSFPTFTRRGVQTPDQGVVQALVGAVSTLVDNPELRHRMGRRGRWMVERGPCSVEARNTKLQAIFDEATQEVAEG